MRLISKRAFRQYMEFRRMTNKELAAKVGCSESSIAFLRSEKKSARDSIGRDLAIAIEEALNAPPGSLFAATVIVDSQSNKRAA